MEAFWYYKQVKKAAIIGFGRFGELLANLGKDTFDLYVIEPDPARREAARQSGFRLISFESLDDVELIFLSVPISQIEDTIQALVPFVDERHLIIDICSVKVYPARLMQKYLTKSMLLATHPMFGPDSAKSGLKGLRVAFCPLRIDAANAEPIRSFWTNLGATVTVTTPEQHDKDSVYSQAFTHSVARIIRNMHLPQVDFRTRSFDSLTQVAQFSANDSEQLFHDMLFYNPYYPDMKKQFEAAIEQTRQRLDEIEAERLSASIL